MTDIRLGIVGVGKIARDQHIPSIAQTDGISIVASASRHASSKASRSFRSLAEMLAADVDLDAVSLCTPPQVRHADALTRCRPASTSFWRSRPARRFPRSIALIDAARSAGVSLFATWHSRFAPAVEPARAWAADAAIESVHVEWKEDVRHWHPGQDWIWEPGGLGVFDPGINALSIVTAILPRRCSWSARPSPSGQPRAADRGRPRLSRQRGRAGDRRVRLAPDRVRRPGTSRSSTDKGRLALSRRQRALDRRHGRFRRARCGICRHLSPIRRPRRLRPIAMSTFAAAPCRRRLPAGPPRDRRPFDFNEPDSVPSPIRQEAETDAQKERKRRQPAALARLVRQSGQSRT